MPLTYHAGQLEVQQEANTRPVADMLAHWVGPIGEFMRVADLVFLVTRDASGGFDFASVSGKPPLIDVIGARSVRLPALNLTHVAEGAPVGGIAINLDQRRRARLNGRLLVQDGSCTLEAEEAFTNCRKYIAPSSPLDDTLHVGPERREDIGFDDPWLIELLSRAETSFLATVSPEGLPDLSHRGGPPGFYKYEPSRRTLLWNEYVGDGMFKSAGNVRATPAVSLIVLDLLTGDALRLGGEAQYKTLRTAAKARSEGLEQHREPFPVQGEMTLRINQLARRYGLMKPRRRNGKALKVTSASPLEEQAPQ
jgi:hypothetical protein